MARKPRYEVKSNTPFSFFSKSGLGNSVSLSATIYILEKETRNHARASRPHPFSLSRTTSPLHDIGRHEAFRHAGGHGHSPRGLLFNGSSRDFSCGSVGHGSETIPGMRSKY